MTKILVLHGPNLNMLGKRDTQVYGKKSLAELNALIHQYGDKQGVQIVTAQSNLEGEMIDWIQAAEGTYDGIVLNPGGYTHTSVAIRDAIQTINLPVIEVHLSNILGREEFRQVSVIAPVCQGTVMGLGLVSYLLGVQAMVYLLQENIEEIS